MTRLAEIEGHIVSMGELNDIVGAMRSLAGMRVQEAERALPGIRRYAQSMAAGIGAGLLLMPEPASAMPAGRGQRALILCAAEHGFVGGFNEHLVAAAEAALAPGDRLFVLGSRGAALAEERGCKPAWWAAMATRAAGASETVGQLTAELYAGILRSEIGRVELMFARFHQGAAPAIERRLLLPLDTAALALGQRLQPPLHTLPAQRLLEQLMAEYVFALLVEAAVESIASENAARFTAMQSAHDNVGKKLDELRQGARQARQGEITEELLDLITGAETVGG